MHLVTLFDTIRENGQQGHARRGEVFFHGSKLALPPPPPPPSKMFTIQSFVFGQRGNLSCNICHFYSQEI